MKSGFEIHILSLILLYVYTETYAFQTYLIALCYTAIHSKLTGTLMKFAILVDSKIQAFVLVILDVSEL